MNCNYKFILGDMWDCSGNVCKFCCINSRLVAQESVLINPDKTGVTNKIGS